MLVAPMEAPMSEVASWFEAGGAWMYAVLLLDVLGLGALALAWAVALYGRIRGRSSLLVRGLPAMVLLGAFLPVVVGAVGAFLARSAALSALGNADPAARGQLLENGLAEAMVPLRFGGGSTVLLGMLAVLALMIAPWRSRQG
jgi:hypothetical protein